MAVGLGCSNEPLHECRWIDGRAGAKSVFQNGATAGDDRFVEKSFRLRVATMCRDVGLRRGANVELQSPGALAANFAAPELEGANFRELAVQANADSAALAAAPRLEGRANR